MDFIPTGSYVGSGVYGKFIKFPKELWMEISYVASRRRYPKQ